MQDSGVLYAFVNGWWSTCSANIDTSVTNRVITANIITLENDVDIKIASGFYAGYTVLNAGKAGTITYLSGKGKIPKDTPLRLFVRRVTEQSETADIPTFCAALTIGDSGLDVTNGQAMSAVSLSNQMYIYTKILTERPGIYYTDTGWDASDAAYTSSGRYPCVSGDQIHYKLKATSGRTIFITTDSADIVKTRVVGAGNTFVEGTYTFTDNDKYFSATTLLSDLASAEVEYIHNSSVDRISDAENRILSLETTRANSGGIVLESVVEDLKLGAISGSTGAVVVAQSAKGMVTPTLIGKTYPIVISNSAWDTYKIRAIYYESDGTWKSTGSFASANINISAGSYFRLEIQKITDTRYLTFADQQAMRSSVKVFGLYDSSYQDSIFELFNKTRYSFVEQDVPDYVDTEIARVEAELKTKMALGNVAVLGFNTDQHIRLDNDDRYCSIWGLRALKKLTDKIPFNLVCLGGDEPYPASQTVQTILDSIMLVDDQVNRSVCPVVSVTGNHDAYQNNNGITSSQMYNVHFRRYVAQKFVIGQNNETTNGYIDDASVKIRYIFCDTSPRTGYVALDECKDWLANCLSSLPDGYHAITFSHHALTDEFNVSGEMYQGLACQSVLNPYSDKLICCVCGHGHKTGNATSTAGILYIAVTAAMFSTNSAEVFDLDTAPCVFGTAAETAYDIFVVDQDAQHVYTIRYGAGGAASNRDMTYTLT